MRAVILSIILAIGLIRPAIAQGNEIEGVISSQIEAFKADDFAKAFSFASPGIQGIFRTPENFGRMVAQGYPMVWRPAEVQYLDLSDQAGNLRQTVQITDAQGQVYLLAYYMIETRDGWKINGVQILQAPGVAA
ncbi:MAG: DUF4864 domain-containing protein [Pseudomonadota bacterium]